MTQLPVAQEEETWMRHDIQLMELVQGQVVVEVEVHLEIVEEAGSFVGVVLMACTLVQEVSVLAKNYVHYLFIMRLFRAHFRYHLHLNIFILDVFWYS
jgi:hypothetical protein